MRVDELRVDPEPVAGSAKTAGQHVSGAQLLASSPLLAPAANLVRWHHERADGSGYPDGLSGDQIPVEAGIISVCDAWDAMTYARHYRAALDPEHAHQILDDGAGTQWHTHAVDLLVQELDQNGAVSAAVFETVGRTQTHGEADDDVCLDALPDQVKRRLAHAVAAPANRLA